MLILDSGAVSRLADRTTRSLAVMRALRAADLWPPVVPTAVIVESLHGRPGRHANVNGFLKRCIIESSVSMPLARRAADLRRRAARGSAVDALVVALAEPGGTILTGDLGDLQQLAIHADDVGVVGV